MTPQSKKMSLLESLTQQGVGFWLSILVGQYFIPWFLNVPLPLMDNIILTSVFFIVSAIRGYLIRRLFVWLGNSMEPQT